MIKLVKKSMTKLSLRLATAKRERLEGSLKSFEPYLSNEELTYKTQAELDAYGSHLVKTLPIGGPLREQKAVNKSIKEFTNHKNALHAHKQALISTPILTAEIAHVDHYIDTLKAQL